jgi:Ser/Thr protein kinase RdoA (MazF antagonist)
MTHESHEAVLLAWLPLVQLDPARLERFALLGGGVSGSYVFRLHGYAQPYVLKLTLASTPAYARERSRREIAFHQHLAPEMPVQVPQVYSSFVEPDQGGSAVLLGVYAPPLPPSAWTETDYDEVARQLARLHGRFWNATERLSRFEWLRRPAAVAPEEVAGAQRAWQALQQQEAFRELFTAPRQQLLHRLLATIEHTSTDGDVLPLTLCHGDCHMDNLLRDDTGALVWADWQEVGLGYGPDDLSFFYQRAMNTGVEVLFAPMLATYHAELAEHTGQPIALSVLRARAAHHELYTRLLHWPHYLIDAEPGIVAAQLERIERLADAKEDM